ncbi:MAG: hypothetical protein K2H60_00070 [Muribaculaceae bacterium]|nr:hypothetical protein [Muribaculaceae bacterium]
MANKRSKTSKEDKLLNRASKESLYSICNAYDALRPFFEVGIGAVKKSERKFIQVPDTSRLGGSVNLDEAAKSNFPHDNRWDYAIEYDKNLFLIEIHPASTSEIDCIISKVQFVTKWLKTNVPEILNLPKKEAKEREFYWVSSGKTDLRIAPGSRQAKRLAINHIKAVGKTWDYSKLFK